MVGRLSRTLENNLWKMAAVRLCFWTHFAAAVIVPFFRDWGGLSYTRIFLLNGWFMFWSFLLEVPTGTVADLFGRRLSIALGALAAAAGWMLYASLPDFRVFLAAEVVIAISFALGSGADEALVYETLAGLGVADRARSVFARLESFKLGGILLGALGGGLLASRFGVRAPVLAQVIPALAAFLLAMTLAEPAPRRGARSIAAYLQTLRFGLGYLRAHKATRALTADMVSSVALAWLLIWLYQPQLERAGVPLGGFGLVHAAMCLAQMAVLANLERVVRLVGSTERYLVLAAMAPGIAYLGLAMSSHPVPVIAWILLGAGLGLSRPTVFLSHLNEHIPSEQRATILSCVSMARTLTIAVVQSLAGVMVDAWMSGALAAFGAVALALSFLFRAREEDLVARSRSAGRVPPP